jgi:GMP synthase (glutamine-hydrolysing)
MLLQVRNQDDPMREHEIGCFERCFRLEQGQVEVLDLLKGPPSIREIEAVDIVLLGGSGDYSVVTGGDWFLAAREMMLGLYEMSKPTFASGWGFQAMSMALGGHVVTDRTRAEVGVTWMNLTPEGEADPVFGGLDPRFQALSGHEDIVTEIPASATLLASSDTVRNQAFTFPGKPIYCTQFHPELDRAGLIARLAKYPAYVRLAGAETLEELAAITPETPHTEDLLRRFLDVAMAAV